MAKITFSKLGLVKDTSVETFDWNDQTIEVKTYLPIADKLRVVENILNQSIDANGYYNPARVYVNMIVEVILAYTNITVTEKQREDIYKLYDLFVSSGLSGEIIGNHMNPNEYAQIKTWTIETIHNIYEYRNSAYGIMEGIVTDYSNLNLQAENIQQKINNPEDLSLLKNVLTKLG